jgi:two-component system, NtrC family, nitrogen regulation sensor histidine kinase NtrY
MVFRASRPARFVLGVTIRAVLIGGLSFLAVWLAVSAKLYATLLVVVILIAVIVASLVSMVKRAARWLEDDIEALTAEVIDVPSAAFGPRAAAESPLDRARSVLNAARTEQQRHRDYLQTLLDTVSASLFAIQEDGRVVLVNRAAARFAGAAVDRLEQVDAIGPRAAGALLAMRPGTRQIVPLADGRQVFAVVSAFSVPGRPVQRLLAIQRIAGDLDAVELKAWQDMVQVLTHEMMNSLTPISSLSESLETLLRSGAGSRGMSSAPAGASTGAPRALADDVAGALEAIRRRSLGLMEFVERYRTVAELPSPRRQLVSVERLLSGIDRLIGPALREKGVEFRTSIQPRDLQADADPQLLEQAMINLLRNAADAVASVENPRIDVKCEQRDGQVLIAVCDNGAGVPENQRDQIFVPFFTTKPGGSGVGLSLARHIALGHGGQLDIRSAEPRGSVFTLSLPVTVTAARL